MSATHPSYQRLPQYRPHKTVHAVQIKEIKKGEQRNRCILVPVQSEIEPIEVDAIFVRMKNMAPGWYYVVDDKGWATAKSPEEFEESYSLATLS